MILTAVKPVNARLGKPSINAPNPRFLISGEKVNVKSRVIGDSVNGNTEWILTEENEFFTAEGFHNIESIRSIPFFSDLKSVPKLFTDLEISKLWNISKGEKVNLGIIDNGVANHPSLRGKVKELNPNSTMAQDLNGHGTTMACIISALDESKGKIGISPLVENIFSYTINVATIQPDELTQALDLMQNARVNILNLSFSCDDATFFKPRPNAIKLQNKINELVNNGCIIVSATGNNHRRNLDFYPAKYDNVISVAGFDSKGALDIDSNLWNGISISMSSDHYYYDSQFQHSNGTSGATAIISGCIACVYHSLKGPTKFQTVTRILSKLPPLKIQFNQTEISVPKFDTEKFIQTLNV